MSQKGDRDDNEQVRFCRISHVSPTEEEIEARLTEIIKVPTSMVVPTPDQPPMQPYDVAVDLVSWFPQPGISRAPFLSLPGFDPLGWLFGPTSPPAVLTWCTLISRRRSFYV